MAVTQDDVRHVAELARLAVDENRLDHLVAELNGILQHMDVLSQADTSTVDSLMNVPVDSTPLRSDSSGPLLMATPRESFAPSMKDGLFIVPRLASHEDASDSAP
ncbi:MAG TPA: Asp-tRNA(Asn)/Glu-tRNA(Gln) amidotransferase subunit GatC [Gemmatimonadaceae bacterium]|nr:Asp-tRNA(Asn)/Glu-tRNA(Gln) amidotransferase subunit GatC [Gemmatimonadaceae bacterium]